MDVNDGIYDGLISSSSEDSGISLETSPPPQVSDSGSVPTTNPGPSADIPPDPTSRPPERGRPYYDGLSLVLVQQQAIRRWREPRHPEYSTLARHIRSFYDRQSDGEGKPSAESIAAAGFYYDGRSTYLNFKLSNLPLIFKFQTFESPATASFIHPRSCISNFQISCTYLNSNFQISRTYLNSNLRVSSPFHPQYTHSITDNSLSILVQHFPQQMAYMYLLSFPNRWPSLHISANF